MSDEEFIVILEPSPPPIVVELVDALPDEVVSFDETETVLVEQGSTIPPIEVEDVNNLPNVIVEFFEGINPNGKTELFYQELPPAPEPPLYLRLNPVTRRLYLGGSIFV